MSSRSFADQSLGSKLMARNEPMTSSSGPRTGIPRYEMTCRSEIAALSASIGTMRASATISGCFEDTTCLQNE
jgi:hypothetical protein